MAVLSTMKLVGAVVLLGTGVNGQIFLAPEQDIVLPASDSATEPLKWLGANSPYFAGPNINGISNAVPEGCTVEQVAYNVRHGSRYPDTGAYNQWTALYAKIQAANFTATGSMAFLKDWEPVLTNPTLQIAQESTTGYKEAYDLGYTLRTRYPKLYAYGTPFISWANLYPRVVQTAQNFVRGFLGSTAASLGQVITVNSTGSEQALFDSLSPSDLCPAFVDGNGGNEQTEWNSIYLPPILARLESLIDGNLTFTTSDVSIMPYLCGFESQITGTLSPWCSVFTDTELKQYEYAQDLRYYYGIGPGVDLASKMMLPYLDTLIGLLNQGPGINGTYANGSTYTLPNIITAFMNDGQITELGAATGVWDDTISLGNGTEIPDGYTYIASRFVSMRGTVAFERLNCVVSAGNKGKREEEEEEDKIITITKKKTVTSCAETETITIPAEETTTKTPEMTTSTVVKTETYTISSCRYEDKECRVGDVTSTVYTSTTVCPVEVSTTSEPASASRTSYLSSASSTATATGNGSSGFVTKTSSGSGISGTGPASLSNSGSASITSSPTSTFSSSTYLNTTRSTTSTSHYLNTTSTTSSLPTSTPTSTSQTYIRILLNDAVYPVPSCHSGPGKSCLMSEYVALIKKKVEDAGDLVTRCNVTNPQAPMKVKGASFFTDLGGDWFGGVVP